MRWPIARQNVEEELPVTSKKSSKLPDLAVSQKSEHHIELKTTFWQIGGPSSEAFAVEANLFFPAELQAVHTEVFGNAFATASYHTPEVALEDALPTASRLGLEYIPSSPTSSTEVSGDEEQPHSDRLARLIQHLQVTACVLRKAMRSAAKELAKLLQEQGQQHEMAGVEAASFVTKLCTALSDFDQLIQPLKGPPEGDSTQLSAGMVQEFLLLEAESTLLKLLQLSSPALSPGVSSKPLQQMQHDTHGASAVLAQAVLSIQEQRLALGYDSPTVEDDEAYTQYVKLLKRNARSSITLFHQERPRLVLHPVLVDVVGSLIAGLSMLWALLAIYMGQRAAHVSINRNPLGLYAPAVMVANVGGYVLKDRMKIWGQRYLTPVAQALGWDFPDRTAAIIDHKHQVLARYDESCAVVRDQKLDPDLLTEQQKSPKAASMPLHQERVLVHRKRINLHWQHWARSVPAMEGLDDVLRYDLSPFCRKMEPAHEAYLRLAPKGSSGYMVEQVPCARVYRLHLAVRITAVGTGQPASSLHRATIVMDKAGIKRLEFPAEEPA